MVIERSKFRCKYPFCLNKYIVGGVNKRFYFFPKTDNALCNRWKSFCSISYDVKADNFRLCEDHFKESDFWNSEKTRLKYGAKPSLPDISTIQPSCSSGPSSTYQNYNHSCENSIFNVEENSNNDETNIFNVEEVFQLQDSAKIVDIDETNVNAETNQGLNVNTETNVNAEKGILRAIGLSKKDLTPTKSYMYQVHRSTQSKISKLRLALKTSKNAVKSLKKICDSGKFEITEESLNSVTKEFINSQLRNSSRKAQGKRWTVEDKTFALSMYKRSPRLYRYLISYFQLPSIRTLKQLLSRIPFETGINEPIMDQLKIQVDKMNELDRHCVLLFDEISLSEGLYYEQNKNYISGYVDLGHLGRTNQTADHALVFMVRGIRKSWKQVVAYYFTSKTVQTHILKKLIVYIIGKLLSISLKVVATVCDQGSTNRAALTQLASENRSDPSPFYFKVNDVPICIIYDVSHLLKNTRNALLRCTIQFGDKKKANFEHIDTAFNLDQARRTFKMLPKLRRDYFNFQDSRIKMKVKIAAAQLSYSVAACIETWVSSGDLPSEAANTAEFVHKVDCLFDSLNGYSFSFPEGKPLKGVLRDDSPHIQFWSDMLKELREWKLINKADGKDVTNQFKFIQGWQTSIRSIIYLWNKLKITGFNYFSLRSFNQDPLENLYCILRQHGFGNDNPSCHQFVAALKTSVVNGLTSTVTNSNCENDNCENLNNLSYFLQRQQITPDEKRFDEEPSTSDISTKCDDNLEEETIDSDSDIPLLSGDNQATAYVAGYLLHKIKIPDCQVCQKTLYCNEPLNEHIFITFKEYCNNKTKLIYPSLKLTNLIEEIHEKLYKFLNEKGHERDLIMEFKNKNEKCFAKYVFCTEHNIVEAILQQAIKLIIFKYIKDKKMNTRCDNKRKRK